MDLHVSERLVSVLMTMNRIAGLLGPGKVKRVHGVSPPVMWSIESFTDFIPMNSRLTDIIEHPSLNARFTVSHY
jgi:hypothetical protein